MGLARAIDAVTREIVGVHIADHSAESAQGLWQSLPPVYRCLCCDRSVISGQRTQLSCLASATLAVGKETGKTSYPIAVQLHVTATGVEIGSFIRCPPKSWTITRSAIWNFIHHYNASLPVISSFPL